MIMEEIKLKVTDYIFTYANEDMYNVNLKINKINIENSWYGKKEMELKKYLNFELEFEDINQNKYDIEFSIEDDIKYYNSLIGITNINDKIQSQSIYYNYPGKEDGSPIRLNFENDIFNENDNFYILKEKENSFIIKGSLPTYLTFFWFRFKLN